MSRIPVAFIGHGNPLSAFAEETYPLGAVVLVSLAVHFD